MFTMDTAWQCVWAYHRASARVRRPSASVLSICARRGTSAWCQFVQALHHGWILHMQGRSPWLLLPLLLCMCASE